MTGVGEGHAMASSVDARLALRAEAMVEADALADLDVEERLREDEEADDTPKTSPQSQAAVDAAGASKVGQPQQSKNQTLPAEGSKTEQGGEDAMVEIGESKKKSKKKKKSHSKHGKKKHSKDKP